jgi:hypothetical protein
VLRDDRSFFPRYDAVLVMRSSLDDRALVVALAGRIDDEAMRGMNAQVEIEGRTLADVARAFLARGTTAAAAAPAAPLSRWAKFIDRLAPDLGRLLREHLALVFGSLGPAVAIGLPLACWRIGGRHRRHRRRGRRPGPGHRRRPDRQPHTAYMMAGAIPAALLALVVQWTFDLRGRIVSPRRSSSA